jgi:hypothetical protein
MITLQEFMDIVEYRVSEGSDFGWTCFGPAAYSISAWNGDNNGWSANVIFNTKDQTVYIVEACDYKHNRAYRFINPNHADAYKAYAKKHHAKYADQAWDNISYIDLEDDDDWIQKALAIVAGKDYDTRVSVPLDFPDVELLKYMKAAHEQDITFNEFVTRALTRIVNTEIKYPVDHDALTHDQVNPLEQTEEQS